MSPISDDKNCLVCKSIITDKALVETAYAQKLTIICSECWEKKKNEKFFLNKKQETLAYFSMVREYILNEQESKFKLKWAMEFLTKSDNWELKALAIEILDSLSIDTLLNVKWSERKIGVFLNSDETFIRDFGIKVVKLLLKNNIQRKELIDIIFKVLKSSNEQNVYEDNNTSSNIFELLTILQELDYSKSEIELLFDFQKGLYLENRLPLSKLFIDYDEYYPYILEEVLQHNTGVGPYQYVVNQFFCYLPFKKYLLDNYQSLNPSLQEMIIETIVDFNLNEDSEYNRLLHWVSLHERESQVRNYAASHARFDRKENKFSIEHIITKLSSGDLSLGIDISERAPTVPILALFLNHPSSEIRLNALLALRGIGGSVLVEYLTNIMEKLDDNDSYVRGYAAATLGDIRSREAIPRLVKAATTPLDIIRFNYYNDGSGLTRIYEFQVMALKALQKMGASLDPIIGRKLLTFLDSSKYLSKGLHFMESKHRGVDTWGILTRIRENLLKTIYLAYKGNLNHEDLVLFISDLENMFESLHYFYHNEQLVKLFSSEEEYPNFFSMEEGVDVIDEHPYWLKPSFDDAIIVFQLDTSYKIDTWMKGLKNKHKDAAILFGQCMTFQEEKFTEALFKSTKNCEKEEFLFWVIWALGRSKLTEKNPEIVNFLLEKLQDSSLRVKLEVAYVLNKFTEKISLDSNISDSIRRLLDSTKLNEVWTGLRIIELLEIPLNQKETLLLSNFVNDDPMWLGKLACTILTEQRLANISNNLFVINIVQTQDCKYLNSHLDEVFAYCSSDISEWSFIEIMNQINDIPKEKEELWRSLLEEKFVKGTFVCKAGIVHFLTGRSSNFWLEILHSLLKNDHYSVTPDYFRFWEINQETKSIRLKILKDHLSSVAVHISKTEKKQLSDITMKEVLFSEYGNLHEYMSVFIEKAKEFGSGDELDDVIRGFFNEIFITEAKNRFEAEQILTDRLEVFIEGCREWKYREDIWDATSQNGDLEEFFTLISLGLEDNAEETFNLILKMLELPNLMTFREYGRLAREIIKLGKDYRLRFLNHAWLESEVTKTEIMKYLLHYSSGFLPEEHEVFSTSIQTIRVDSMYDTEYLYEEGAMEYGEGWLRNTEYIFPIMYSKELAPFLLEGLQSTNATYFANTMEILYRPRVSLLNTPAKYLLFLVSMFIKCEKISPEVINILINVYADILKLKDQKMITFTEFEIEKVKNCDEPSLTKIFNLLGLKISKSQPDGIDPYIYPDEKKALEILKSSHGKSLDYRLEAGHVVDLSIVNEELTKLPSEFASFQFLRNLNLSKNKFAVIPLEVFRIQSLKNIDMMENELEEIDDNIKHLVNLEVLYLEKNHILSLPQSLLHLKQLETLNLSFNDLTTIPRWLSDFDGYLNITDNNPIYLHLDTNITTIKKLVEWKKEKSMASHVIHDLGIIFYPEKLAEVKSAIEDLPLQEQYTILVLNGEIIGERYGRVHFEISDKHITALEFSPKLTQNHSWRLRNDIIFTARIPRAVTLLTHLKRLSLSIESDILGRFKRIQVSETLSQLTNLESLQLPTGCEIINLPTFIEKIKKYV